MVRRSNHVVEHNTTQQHIKRSLLFLDDSPLLTVFTIVSQVFLLLGLALMGDPCI